MRWQSGVGGGGRGAVLSIPRIRSPSFSEPVPRACDLHKSFSVFFTPLGRTGRLE